MYADRDSLLGTETAFKMGPFIKEVEETGNRVIKCNLGEPDFPLAKHIREEVKRALDADFTHYTDPQGIQPLREAIARDMGAKRNLSLTPDRVVVFPGAKPPIGFCQQVYCNPGDEVIYPSPGFPIYESFVQYIGAKPVPVHLDEAQGFSLSGEDLEPLITPKTKMIFLNFPSNPTGGVATQEQLEGIARVIQRKASADVRVYSDEVYENILFDGSVHRSIASVPGMEARTILVSGVSKTYSWTGGRIGWAVFPTAEEAVHFKNLNINYFSCVPPFNQMGAKAAIESRESPPEITRMVGEFQRRRDIVIEGLRSIRGIECQVPKGAFYLFPNISGVCESVGALTAYGAMSPQLKERTTPATLVQMFLLFRYYVATLDRRSFGRIGSDGKHYLRISIATSLPDLEEAVRRFRLAVEDRAGFEAFVREGRHLF
jgi:aspartate/methionine/tyrosine aminotransferase